MSRARLEERTGRVICHGLATLAGFLHRFDHQGSDGTAKGNIAEEDTGEVHGVLYELSDSQIELLQPFEGGYRRIDVEIVLVEASRRLRAYTYISERRAVELLPTAGYVEHYIRGMAEHDFPEEYREVIRRQAKS